MYRGQGRRGKHEDQVKWSFEVDGVRYEWRVFHALQRTAHRWQVRIEYWVVGRDCEVTYTDYEMVDAGTKEEAAKRVVDRVKAYISYQNQHD